MLQLCPERPPERGEAVEVDLDALHIMMSCKQSASN